MEKEQAVVDSSHTIFARVVAIIESAQFVPPKEIDEILEFTQKLAAE
jgi:hypothetical protein